MQAHDIKELIDGGEGPHVEFKGKISSAEKVARALIAFANTKGGTYLFSAWMMTGRPVGVESEKTELDLIELAGNHFCDPPIEPSIAIIPFNSKDVIAASVDESDDKPHYFLSTDDGEENKVFIRVNDKTVLASREVIKVFGMKRQDPPPLRISIGKMKNGYSNFLRQMNGLR